MPFEAFLKTLVQRQLKSGVERVDHVDRRRVMIGAVLTPVVADHGEVEVPARYRVLPAAQRCESSFAQRDRRQPGRHGQTFLRAGECGIHAPGVDLHRATGERRDAIHQAERTRVPGHTRQRLTVRQRARRRFRVNEIESLARC